MLLTALTLPVTSLSLPWNNTLATVGDGAHNVYLTHRGSDSISDTYVSAISVEQQPAEVLWHCRVPKQSGGGGPGGSANTTIALQSSPGTVLMYLNDGGASGYCGFSMNRIGGPGQLGDCEAVAKISSPFAIQCNHVFSSPPVESSDGTIYSTSLYTQSDSGGGWLSAHAAGDLSLLWRWPPSTTKSLDGPLGPPQLIGDNVIFTSRGELQCVCAHTGRVCASH